MILLPDVHLKSALLLESPVRLQSFDRNLPISDVQTQDSQLTPYLRGVLIDKVRHWGVIDIDVLSNSAPFSNIGMGELKSKN